MQLLSITIKNFRSITKASKVPLSSFTVLLGANNEGKSNVLRALVISIRAALGQRSRAAFRRPFGPPPEDVYTWERDYPVQLQEKNPTGHSEFILEFALTPEEEEQFLRDVGSKVKTPLPIELWLGPSEAQLFVRKRGPGSAKVAKKRTQISAFLAERVDFDYIPAIRTADAVENVIGSLVIREMTLLERNTEYVEALARIRVLQRPLFEALSRSIQTTLSQFLPAVTGVEIEAQTQRRTEQPRHFDIFVNDGTATELRYKGDGVQSLAALALLRFAADRGRSSKDVILAVEEPESHLHPNAIHELHAVLRQLASVQQVVLTTHCPLFVDRHAIQNNVLVQRGRAKPANTVSEIRAVLGVRAADNLLHASLVLVVEGETDRIALSALLAARSKILAWALSSNRLAIDTLGGARNLTYKLGLLRNALCEYRCFMDHDNEGMAAAQTAMNERLLTEANITYAFLPHLEQTEFEDLLDEGIVLEALKDFSVFTLAVDKSSRRLKWSDRMRAIFQASGQAWSSSAEGKLKFRVAELVKASPLTAARASTSGVINNLVAALESAMTTNHSTG